MTTEIRWAKGGEAKLVAIEDDRVTVSSTSSAPPGSSIDGALNDGTTLRIKVRGCKFITDEDRFRIEGRILDPSRGLRERLKI